MITISPVRIVELLLTLTITVTVCFPAFVYFSTAGIKVSVELIAHFRESPDLSILSTDLSLLSTVIFRLETGLSIG